jgi:hypothetical protein
MADIENQLEEVSEVESIVTEIEKIPEVTSIVTEIEKIPEVTSIVTEIEKIPEVKAMMEKLPEALVQEVKAMTDEFEKTLKVVVVEQSKKLPDWLTCLFDWAASLRKPRQNVPTPPSSA